MKNSVLISMMIIVCFTAVASAASKDLILYRAAGNYWYASHTQDPNVWLNYVTTTYTDGAPLGTGNYFKPLIGDVNGDGIDDIVATYERADPNLRCTWHAGHSITESGSGLFSTAAQSSIVEFGGNAGLVALYRFLADLDGDGYDDAIVCNNTYNWNARLSTSAGLGTVAFAGGPFQFGGGGDIPLVGDVNGDGYADVVVFRPSNGAWLVMRSDPTGFGVNGGVLSGTSFGGSGDTPFLGDVNGDGRADGIVVSDTNADGLLDWRAGYADEYGVINWHGGDPAWETWTQFGKVGDAPFVADINGDGKVDIGFIRTSNISGSKFVYVGFTATDGKLYAGGQEGSDRALYGATGDINLVGRLGTPPTNVNGSALPDEVVCVYQVDGDTNGDCVVNLADLVSFVGNWMIDCAATPGDPECTY
jgi:hypothetical protein